MSFQKALDRIQQAQATNSAELRLSQLKLTNDDVARLLPKIGQLANLTALYLDQNQLTEVPKELGQLANLTALSLSHNQLTEVPKELTLTDEQQRGRSLIPDLVQKNYSGGRY